MPYSTFGQSNQLYKAFTLKQQGKIGLETIQHFLNKYFPLEIVRNYQYYRKSR
jgi:hypothetical protein